MIPNLHILRGGVLLATGLACVKIACAAEPAIIARARAFLGSEAAIAGLKSVQYFGTLETADPADPSKKSRAKIEIVLQKPEQQRIAATYEKMVEVTALDGYEGWQRVEDPADRTKWRQTLLNKDQIKRLRANLWENLSYFRGIEQVGGSMEDQGTATIDGVTCQKIAFIHAPNIVFVRYFDLSTGRLVFTETEAGGTIREQGEVVVQGIRFPRSILTVSKDGKGQSVTVAITFEKIVVNETFPAKLFAVPAPVRAQ